VQVHIYNQINLTELTTTSVPD